MLIPQRVFSSWIPSSGPREIIRALTGTERTLVTDRAVELRSALLPCQEDERNRAGAAIADMLGGWRSMRRDEPEAVLATVESIARLLVEYPLWAIERGCRMIRSGDAGLDKRFAPNDAEICGVIKGVVHHYRRMLCSADAILAAPVQPGIMAQTPQAVCCARGHMS